MLTEKTMWIIIFSITNCLQIKIVEPENSLSFGFFYIPNISFVKMQKIVVIN